MEQPEEIVRTIPIPENTGVPGFLRVLEEIIKLPRVQEITIEALGRITYRRYVLEGEADTKGPIQVDLSHLQPHHIIRNASVEEYLYPPGTPAPSVLGAVLDRATLQKYTPIAFATGAGSYLYPWYFYSTGSELQTKDRLMGYPLYFDRALPDTTLVLCTGDGRTHSLVDTRYSIKIEIPMMRVMSGELEVT